MFAYVKYGAKCPRHEAKKIVPVSEIRNFDSQNIGKRNKSYNIECGESYCAAIIIFTDETEEGLKKKIDTKRQSVPPEDLIESASEVDNPSVSSAATQQAARQKSGDQVKKLLQKKLDALQNKTPHKTNKYPTVSDKHTNNNILQDRTNNVPEERQAIKRKNPGLSGDGKGSVNSEKSVDKVIVDSTPKKAKPNSSEKGDTKTSRSTVPGKSSTMKMSNGKTSGETLKNAPEERDTKTSRSTVTGKSSTMKMSNGKTSGETQKNAPESSNARAVKLLSDEVSCLKKKCSKYEDKITEQKVMIKDLTQLNMELQRDIIEYFEDFKAMARQYEGAVRNLEGADTPPTGYHQKSSNKIHLGRNVWIDKKVYDDALSAAKTNQLFVKTMAVAVFGYRVLETHSVSGKKCNKFKDRPAKPGLDGNKILAIRDIFQHWLQTTKSMTEYDAYVAACKTGTYISHKIADLLRSAASTAKEKSSTEVNPDVVDKERDDGEVVRSEADGLVEESDEGADTPDEVDDNREGSDDLVDDSAVNRNVGLQPASGDESELDLAQIEEHKNYNDSDAHTDGEHEENENREENGVDVEDVEEVEEEDNEEKEGDE